jgi:BirA family biotin operon repressor/biotin-[acetyl-CoA-carboxylase] ligase
MSELAERLTTELNRLRPQRVVGRRVEWKSETDSTNDDCHAAGLASEPGGLVVLAEVQTAGRGQHGRQWRSPASLGLLLSVRLPAPKRGAAFLTAYGAVAVSELLSRRFRVNAQIKWPNDVLVGGKKICGVLAESRRAEVLGIGLNVLQSVRDFPPDCIVPPTSIALETGAKPDRVQTAADLLAIMDQLWSTPTDELYSLWQRRATVQAGDKVVATFSDRAERGTLVELRPDRAVKLQTQEGTVVEDAARLCRIHRCEDSSPHGGNRPGVHKT